MKEVSVIIVNFRTPELSLKAAQSVLGEPECAEVIIVENGSGDSSAEVLQNQAPSGVRVVISTKNLGFGGANNLAALDPALSQAPYLFFLNSDAELEKGGLKLLLEKIKIESVGLVAPAIYESDGKTLQKDAQGNFPTASSLLLQKNKQLVDSLEPDWISGVAFIARSQEFRNLGGFDSSLFMYFEDIDLCRRYTLTGKKITRELRAKVIHLGGGSKQSTVRQKQQYYRAQDHYLKLNGTNLLARLVVRVVRFPYYLIGRLFLWK